jgi:hypothetical protein
LEPKAVQIICCKFSNLLSEARSEDAELTSILWRETFAKISAFFSSGARTIEGVTKFEHD